MISPAASSNGSGSTRHVMANDRTNPPPTCTDACAPLRANCSAQATMRHAVPKPVTSDAQSTRICAAAASATSDAAATHAVPAEASTPTNTTREPHRFDSFRYVATHTTIHAI